MILKQIVFFSLFSITLYAWCFHKIRQGWHRKWQRLLICSLSWEMIQNYNKFLHMCGLGTIWPGTAKTLCRWQILYHSSPPFQLVSKLDFVSYLIPLSKGRGLVRNIKILSSSSECFKMVLRWKSVLVLMAPTRSCISIQLFMIARWI